jgi:nucleoside-diphosphate-sugar epimerase
MKSAFMSDLFHALRDRSDFVCPVSPLATLWLMSVSQCADNLLHALDVGAPRLPDDRALLLPALRVSMSALVAAVARQTGQAAERVRYQPDAGLEAAFGNYPPLRAARAEAAGFAADASADVLVANALEVIAAGA